MNMHEEMLKRQNEGYHTPLPELIERIERDSQKLKPTYAELDIVDAVFYLREYCEKRDEICEIAKIMADSWELHKQTMAFEDRNDPISWDELKQMEGKPVWVELKRKETEVGRNVWGLIDGTYVDAFGYDIVTIKVLHDLWHLSKAQLGVVWKAYWEERHE